MTQKTSPKPPTIGLHPCLAGLEGLCIRITTAKGDHPEFKLLRCDSPRLHHVMADGDHTTPIDPAIRILLVEVLTTEGKSTR
jgi:hypothetical protein